VGGRPSQRRRRLYLFHGGERRCGGRSHSRVNRPSDRGGPPLAADSRGAPSCLLAIQVPHGPGQARARDPCGAGWKPPGFAMGATWTPLAIAIERNSRRQPPPAAGGFRSYAHRLMRGSGERRSFLVVSRGTAYLNAACVAAACTHRRFLRGGELRPFLLGRTLTGHAAGSRQPTSWYRPGRVAWLYEQVGGAIPLPLTCDLCLRPAGHGFGHGSRVLRALLALRTQTRPGGLVISSSLPTLLSRRRLRGHSLEHRPLWLGCGRCAADASEWTGPRHTRGAFAAAGAAAVAWADQHRGGLVWQPGGLRCCWGDVAPAAARLAEAPGCRCSGLGNFGGWGTTILRPDGRCVPGPGGGALPGF